MKNIGWKIGLIVLVLAGFAAIIYPPAERIRLGTDLRGGVSLLYQLDIAPDQDRETVINQVINVLNDRINPTGVLDITIRRQGLERIEIVMPLPTEEVRELRERVDDLTERIVEEASISERELDAALARGEAAAEFGGAPDSDRREAVETLQSAYDRLQEAEAAYEHVQDNPDVEESEYNRIEQRYAAALMEVRDAKSRVLDMTLDLNDVQDLMRMSSEPRPVLDEDDDPVRDPETGERQMQPSLRAVEAERIKSEFPAVAGEIDELLRTYDEYTDKRVALDDPEDLQRLVRGAGVLEFHIAVPADEPEGVNVDSLRQQLRERGPDQIDSTTAGWFELHELTQWYETETDLEALRANPAAYFANRRNMIAGEHDGDYYLLLYTTPSQSLRHDSERQWTITGARRSQDDRGLPAVAFNLDGPGGQMMSALTGPNVGRNMAIVLDNRVYSAPRLQSQIGNRGQITGDFSQSDINYLVRVLTAGTLDATLSSEPVSVNTIGPSVGEDNLRSGLTACLYALVAVAIFMMIYYFFAGAVADFALLANGVIIFGFMAMIDGMFTLPGLAGIVLTIGMAVDANVLIYERIREELFTGESDLRTSVRLGYKKALSTIIDANVTNWIVCLVLGLTATTEVKGFATTLAIGIGATLFTSLFVTRIIFTLYTDFFKLKTLPMLPTVVPAVHRFLEPSINWMGARFGFWGISAVLLAVSVLLVGSRGVELFDTEFRGGATLTMQTRETEDGNRLMLRHIGEGGVEERIHDIGREAGQRQAPPEDPAARERWVIERELARASVLTSGRTQIVDGAVHASRFQVRVAMPAGLEDESRLLDVVVDEIVGEFDDELDVAPALDFRGAGTGDYAAHTYPITNELLGPNINRPDNIVDVTDYLGGVAVVLEDIEPSATTQEIHDRIHRLRQQPDFQAFAARPFRVIGLTPADEQDAEAGYRDVAVVVRDPNVGYFATSLEMFDQRMAEVEWNLISEALQQPPSLTQVSTFSAAVAATQTAAAIMAVVLTLLGILVYIWIRFGSLRFSVAAIVALVHDVILALGILALSQVIGHTTFASFLLIEEFRIDMGVVAALLTIIGYSLNDSIVILDRVRENRGKLPIPTMEQVNRSINQTVSRTVLTSLTTLMAVAIMYVYGGSGIRAFTFVLLAGLVIGTYSSVAVAAPLVFQRDKASPGRLDSAEEPSPL